MAAWFGTGETDSSKSNHRAALPYWDLAKSLLAEVV